MISDNPHFTELGLSQPVLQGIRQVGYEHPSPIQAATIPRLLSGEDILGTAQTGTGKTAAFALPLLSRIEVTNKTPQVLVLTPTRELAIQVAEAFQKYAQGLPGLAVLPIYGGQDIMSQRRQLKRGVQVVVGTPGRVMDHLRRGTLNLDGIKHLVLDEADEMLRMGFIDDVEWILEQIPGERQTALFSATMPPEIRKVANRYMRDPQRVKIANPTATNQTIEQRYWPVGGVHKLDALSRILEVEPFDAGIIFVRTKAATVELAEKLEARGHSAAALNGDMNQALRERTVSRLKSGKIDLVIATDVAARGLDVERITHVINYDIPFDTEAYIHRIGRTGRAGRSGVAILFVAGREKGLLRRIEKATGQGIEPMELPSADAVSAKRVDQFKARLSQVFTDKVDLNFYEDLLADFSQEQNLAPEDIASALAYLLQKDQPLQVAFAPAASKPGPTGKRSRAKSGATPENMKRYRLAVGRSHHTKPGDIVGAIANEVGLEGQHIGHIKLFDEFSTVDLPGNLPPAALSKLKKVRVRNRPLAIELDAPRPGKKPTPPKAKKSKAKKSKPKK